MNKNSTLRLNQSREKVDHKTVEQNSRFERVPFGGHKLKLSKPKIEGFEARWFNDVDARIPDAVRAGYQFVDQQLNLLGVGTALTGNTDIGTLVSRVTGKSEDGKPTRSYLMYIRKDWRDEDRAKKEEARKEVDRTIRRGKFQTGSEPDKTYIPQGGISYSPGR